MHIAHTQHKHIQNAFNVYAAIQDTSERSKVRCWAAEREEMNEGMNERCYRCCCRCLLLTVNGILLISSLKEFQGQTNIINKFWFELWRKRCTASELESGVERGCVGGWARKAAAALRVKITNSSAEKSHWKHIKGEENVQELCVRCTSMALWYTKCIKLYETCSKKCPQTHSNQAVEYAWRLVLF